MVSLIFLYTQVNRETKWPIFSDVSFKKKKKKNAVALPYPNSYLGLNFEM